MHRSLIYLLLLCCGHAAAQTTLTITQRCGYRGIYVFYKDGNEDAPPHRLNDSTVVYQIPVTEPRQVAIVDSLTLRHRIIWTAPAYRHDRAVILDNCTKAMIHRDTLPVDLDDAPYQQVEVDYHAGRIRTRDSLFYYWTRAERTYIDAHPDSFLAAKYLRGLANSVDLPTLIHYRDKVAPHNSQYSDFQFVDRYIANAKYKALPHTGDPFFEFQAQRTDGSIFDSKMITGKAIVLFFWYSGCGPCHRAMEPLQKVYDELHAKGMEVLSFACDEKPDEWRKSSATYHPVGINVSDLQGFSSPIFLHYDVQSFPTFILFDKDKRVHTITFGEDEVPLIESKVKEILGVK